MEKEKECFYLNTVHID